MQFLRVFLRLSSAPLALAGMLALAPSQALAQCSCLCVDGAMKTVCTTAEEAAANPVLCQAHTSRACPALPEGAGGGASFSSPAEGAVNCREAKVYDAAAGDYVTARVCDMASAQQ